MTLSEYNHSFSSDHPQQWGVFGATLYLPVRYTRNINVVIKKIEGDSVDSFCQYREMVESSTPIIDRFDSYNKQSSFLIHTDFGVR